MQLSCPECGARLDGKPGVEMVCPACMTPFLVPLAEGAVRTFDVQPAGDAVIHGMSRHAIREAIYVGRLDAAARVRHDGGAWELIGGYPEFAAVFRVIGGDVGPMAGTRKLAGWGRGDRAEETTAARPAPRPEPPPRAGPTVVPGPPGAPVRPPPPAPAVPPAARAAATPVGATPVAATPEAARDLRKGTLTGVPTLPGDSPKGRGAVIALAGLGVVLVVAVIAAFT